MPEHQQIQQSKKPDTTFQKQATYVSQTPVSNPYSIIQRAKINPKSLTHADVMQLQRTIGNRAVAQLLSGIGSSSTAQQETVQRQEIPEEEEPLQGKMAETVQCQEIPEEEEPLQGKFENKHEIACPSCFAVPTVQRQEIPEEEEPLQGKFENKPEIACPSCFAASLVQRQEIPEEEEPLQGKMIETIQRQEIPEEEEPLQTKMENNTGMPDNLKAGVEILSGIDMSNVSVHYNSSKPAEVGALAYTQGSNIHVAPGQEKHLPHEAWHVVQQAQGRVKPIFQMKGVAVNDDVGLEREADVMGGRAMQMKEGEKSVLSLTKNQGKVVQLYAFSLNWKDGIRNYDYGKEFKTYHLSNKKGKDLEKEAINSSKSIGGDHWTLINQSSFENGEFNETTPSQGYDFALQVDRVEAVSANARYKTKESIDNIVVEGYIVRSKNPWYKVTHLNAAQ